MRLRAHRDMLLKMKKDQRQKELDDFNGKASDKESLYEELKNIDQKVKVKDQISKMEEHFEEESLEGSEYDKRLAMYKNLREQL